jgi:hypothetical protein
MEGSNNGDGPFSASFKYAANSESGGTAIVTIEAEVVG